MCLCGSRNVQVRATYTGTNNFFLVYACIVGGGWHAVYNGICGRIGAEWSDLDGLFADLTLIISTLLLVIVPVVAKLLSEHFILAMDGTVLVHDVSIGVVVAEDTFAVEHGHNAFQHRRFDFHVAET